MAFKTIIGQVARGDDYFPRPQITDEIWKKLESGSNLLLVAPRRVGKTSILYNLLDKPKKNNIVIYYTSESVNNENEFYKKLFNHIVEELNIINKYSAKGKNFFNVKGENPPQDQNRFLDAGFTKLNSFFNKGNTQKIYSQRLQFTGNTNCAMTVGIGFYDSKNFFPFSP